MFWDAALPLLLWIAISSAQDPIRPYPLPDGGIPTTSILDHSSYVQDLDDPQWYLDNIPFVDFPDQSLNDVYYYRASVIKRHLKYAHEGHGWVFTEFIHPVAWGSFPCFAPIKQEWCVNETSYSIEIPDDSRLGGASDSGSTLAPRP